MGLLDSSTVSENSSAEEEEEFEFEDNVELLSIYTFLVARKKREKVLLPKITGFAENIVPGYSRVCFKEHFRMYPDTFEILLGIIGPALNAHNEMEMTGVKHLLLRLWFFSTPDSFRSVASRFGVSKSTAYKAVRRVCYGLYCCAPTFIKCPKGADAVATIRKFAVSKAFPGVIGAIDGTHIPILAPTVDPQSYYNRKGFPSIVLQAVCNSDSIFTHCYAGPGGSVHDARALRLSPVEAYFGLHEEYFPQDSHLIGDAAYPLHEQLLTPFRNNGHLTKRQKKFNYCLSATRMCIERAFGLTKVRFRILLDCLPLTKVEKVPEFIIACCILHNVCMLQGDFFPYEREAQEDHDEDGYLNRHARNRGMMKRDRIIEPLPMERNNN